jgi:hypothetical protein
MYAASILFVHVLFSCVVALTIAPHSPDPTATSNSLLVLCLASAALCMVGFVATSRYLSRRVKPLTGVLVGYGCGMLCCATIGLIFAGVRFSLVIYITLLAPTLLAVLLASVLDRPKSGWQPRPQDS